jgi:hypothetical protein
MHSSGSQLSCVIFNFIVTNQLPIKVTCYGTTVTDFARFHGLSTLRSGLLKRKTHKFLSLWVRFSQVMKLSTATL